MTQNLSRKKTLQAREVGLEVKNLIDMETVGYGVQSVNSGVER